MRKVILESAFAASPTGSVEEHVRYAKDCLQDCLLRGEAPLASHLLYPGVLDDDVPGERALGIAAGLAWLPVADAMVVYVDYGVSPGMRAAMGEAELADVPVEVRSLRKDFHEQDYAQASP
jgi:hypothetical protein